MNESQNSSCLVTAPRVVKDCDNRPIFMMKTYLMPTRIELDCGHEARAEVTLWMTFTGALLCTDCCKPYIRKPSEIRAAIKSHHKPRKKIEE